MIPVDKAVLARFSKGERYFEVFVDADKAQAFRRGENVRIDDIVASRSVYSDAKKGVKVPDCDLAAAFATTDFDVIARKIIKDGEISLTTDQKKRMAEERRKQLIALIARGAVDPRTHLPHPPARIEKALDQTKLHIDPMKPAEAQVEDALKALRPIIPIKIETVKLAVKIPAQNAAGAFQVLRQYKVIKEEWANDGSLIVAVELPAGMQGDFFDRLNRVTQGNVESRVIERH